MNRFKQSSQWLTVAASVCGTSHLKTQQPCQDAHRWRILPDNVLVVAVADGAGSASLGKLGAAIATETVIEHISIQEITSDTLADDDLLSNLLADALLAARKAVENEAVKCSSQFHDLATTLIIAIATPKVAAVAQIGDGLAVGKNSAGELLALTLPNSGEYINETTFLTSLDAIDTAQIKLWRENIVNIGVLTDGLQMLALNMVIGEPHKPFFLPLFDFATNSQDPTTAKEQLVNFLSSDRITQRTDDDLTLVLAAFKSNGHSN
ncbi:PP2C family serine/threonine-protein phosphatase [Cronbergia sp. UHCC 0137]|uniref:PP2C family serine/threonine-protein phosphatase n=1 Tax=Cronbergia sp. UHCC 0137 TaxID=3110239 RepID=UPI002B1FE673|nr:PP2C family serine/threonine-protein phosphatase [Cronbergia sp. UHCC 0137]MEA5616706.1 PP2C family serine/threonine-protein phosphatase [Cronbergia sp. UHCC 0137]